MGQTVASGQLYNVTATQVDTDDFVLSGGTMVVESGGTTSDTTVNFGGTESSTPAEPNSVRSSPAVRSSFPATIAAPRSRAPASLWSRLAGLSPLPS